jgi:glycopeptide antibiotics resistance protein
MPAPASGTGLQGRLPAKIMINTHPQRREDRPLPWLKELTTLTHATVIHLRLDYLLHALMLAPLAPLWRLGFPRHPLRLIIPAGLALAVGLEGVQYLLPYRAWFVIDAIGNGVGVLLSPLFLAMRRPARF